jgi:hypothetical protein
MTNLIILFVAMVGVARSATAPAIPDVRSRCHSAEGER